MPGTYYKCGETPGGRSIEQVAELDEIPRLDLAELPMAADRAVGWAALRDAGPLIAGDGYYTLTRRDDVLEALRNTEVYSSKKAFNRWAARCRWSRSPSIRPSTPASAASFTRSYGMRETLGALLPSLQQQAIDVIDDIAANDSCEVVQELAIPYPSQVFLTLFGLPLEDRDRLVAWKDAIIDIGLLDSLDDADLTPAIELATYLTGAIAEHRRSPSTSCRRCSRAPIHSTTARPWASATSSSSPGSTRWRSPSARRS